MAEYLRSNWTSNRIKIWTRWFYTFISQFNNSSLNDLTIPIIWYCLSF